MKKALITGVEGFVGPYLKKELEENGYEVFGLGCETGQTDKYYCVDITDKKILAGAISAIQPDCVFHLAGISSEAVAKNKPDWTHEVNVNGTKNLLDLLDGVPGVRVLIVSSSHVYGNPLQLPIKEDHMLQGNTVYAGSRIKQEQEVANYFNRMPIVITRSFNHTGPMQPETFVIPKIVKQIVEIKKGKRNALELGNIEVRRDICDVRDVVRAYRLLLEQDKFGIICNVCRGESIKLSDVVEMVKDMAKLTEVKILSDKNINKDEIFDTCGDNTYLKKLTGWKPKYDYKKMLKDIYKYWDSKII